jgi:GxxExxY protein
MKVKLINDLSNLKIHSLTEHHEEIGAAVVQAAFNVHKEFGPGLLEKVYETCLCHELQSAGLQVSRQVNIPLRYKGITLDESLRIDLLVENIVVVEVKSVELVNAIWHSQVLSQLKMTGHRLGYLINFNVPLIKEGIRRIIR